MAAVLTPVQQTKRIRINTNKRNSTKKYTQYKTQEIQVHILRKHSHITKQVKTTTKHTN